MPRLPLAIVLALFVAAARLGAGEGRTLRMPPGAWRPEARRAVGVEERLPAAIGYPGAVRQVLTWTSARPLAAGLYRLRLTLRPSHASDTVAWNGGLRVEVENGRVVPPADYAPLPEDPQRVHHQPVVTWQAATFGAPHRPEERAVEVVLPRQGRLTVRLAAPVYAPVMEVAAGRAAQEKLPETPGGAALRTEPDGAALPELEEAPLSPEEAFYFLLEDASLERLSRAAWIAEVRPDKLQYRPGEEAQCRVDLVGLAEESDGELLLWLERDIDDREMVARRRVALRAGEERREVLPFRVPQEQFGYAVIAEYRSAGGAERAAAREVFGVSDHVWRLAIHVSGSPYEQTLLSEAQQRAIVEEARGLYQNTREMFFWAVDDMIEMSPREDYWFSGQTGYHIGRRGLQRLIRLHQEQGIAVSTYAKFVMSGYVGWRRAFRYPYDHKRQFSYRLGMWKRSSVANLDWYRNMELITTTVAVKDDLLSKYIGGSFFMPIGPDPTPRNVRAAGEEMIRSIEMFGWDACRWDGHPRSRRSQRGAVGGRSAERFNASAQRETQMLIRYFKEIVGARHPGFGHGYNYLYALDDPDYAWAVQDYELDEICRGGGLLMNESIGNHGRGKSFSWFVRNIQVEGDLARERGGFLLCIGRDLVQRDVLVNNAISYAGGARSYGTTSNHGPLNRFATRYSAFLLDEELRRLATPAAVLAPTDETPLWWDAFVYETPRAAGRQRLVVNLLNVPREATVAGEKGPRADRRLLPASDPVTFALTLPEGYAATGAALLDSQTARATRLPLRQGRVKVPAVKVWSVLVLELTAEPRTPRLHKRFGPPTTLDAVREGAPAPEPVRPLDIEEDVTNVNQRVEALFPGSPQDFWEEPPGQSELSPAARNRLLLERQQSAEQILAQYPFGGALKEDLALQASPPAFGSLAPRRDGATDILYVRGPMDYHLHPYAAFGRLQPVRVRELRQSVSGGTRGGRLDGELRVGQMRDYDVQVFVNVAHLALGAERAYALTEWVREGGGALFTGGEWSFTKGGYGQTVLDRELLPVRCAQERGNRYRRRALRLEPGPDLAELGLELSFAEQPSFWCWNECPLRADAEVKVFLQAGNRPMLVGWELGEGRVACLLAMHKGCRELGALPYFEWREWPRLLAAVVAWLAPRAGEREAPAPPPAGLTEALRTDFEAASMEALLDEEADGALLEPSAETAAPEPVTLPAAELAARVQRLETLLRSGDADAGDLLVRQAVAVANLPADLRQRLVLRAREAPPERSVLLAAGRRGLAARHTAIRGTAYQLLALAGGEALPAALATPLRSPLINASHDARYRALARALYPESGLLARARERLVELGRREAVNRRAYTDGEGFSPRRPAVPCLTVNDAYERMCWLAYAVRFEPQTYAEPFVRQWLRLWQRRRWSVRAQRAIGRQATLSGPGGEGGPENWLERLENYEAFLRWLQDLAAPQARALTASRPAAAARAMATARFRAEALGAVYLLGPREAGAPALYEPLLETRLPLLAEFARARLGER